MGGKNSGRTGWETKAKIKSPITGKLFKARMNAIYDEIEKLGSLHSTLDEAASHLGKMFHVELPIKTFHDFLARDKRAKTVWERGQASTKLSLRRTQLKQAQDGNTTMLVWMGKQLLGQTDKSETNNVNTNTTTVQIKPFSEFFADDESQDLPDQSDIEAVLNGEEEV